MAKDDYYVIVAKVLVYLYKKVKGREPVDPGYLKPQTDDFPVTEEYFLYVLEMMERQGFVEGMFIQRTYGGAVYQYDCSKLRILPAGIDYLKDNSTVRRICEGLREASSLASFFAEF